ncbi:FHA domain-containing protein [Phormidesmis sp. 146-33]
MPKKFRFPFVAPVLLLTACSQSLFTQKPQQPDLKQKLREYSEPAVVRVAVACFAEYYYYPTKREKPDKPNEEVRGDYPTNESDGYYLGTGYFINPDGYLVTSAVLGQFAQQFDDRAKCRSKLIDSILKGITVPDKDKQRELTTGEREDIKKSLMDRGVAEPGNGKVIELEDEAIQYSSDVIFSGGERLPFTLKSVSGTGTKSENVALIKVNVTNAPALKFADSDPAGLQGSVWVFGYAPDAELFDPDKARANRKKTELEFVRNFLNEKRQLDSSISDRSISSTPTQDNITTLLIDQRLQYGMLGSPVLNANGEVLGMVTGVGSSYTTATPARTIKGFINVPNNQGETSQKYRSALDSFWKGEYSQADALLKQVQSLFPQYSKIATKIQKNQAESALHPDNPLLPWILLAGVGLLGIPTIAYLLLRRPPQLQLVSHPPEADSFDRTNNDNRPKTRPGNPDPTKVNLKPFIEFSYKDQDLQFYLGEEVYHLGRDSDWSNFEIPNSWSLISRHHAVLRKEGSDYRLYDGDQETPSANGNFVNETRVTTREGYLLRHGTQVKIGPDRNPILLTYFNPMHKQADPTQIANA